MSTLERIRAILQRISDVSVLSFLTALIVLSIIQVLLRKLFNESLPNADGWITMMVYYIALFGAAAASFRGKHIQIEALSKFVGPVVNRIFDVLRHLVSIFVLIVLIQAALKYLEFQAGALDEFAFGIQTYWFEAMIIPAFVLMIAAIVLELFLPHREGQSSHD